LAFGALSSLSACSKDSNDGSGGNHGSGGSSAGGSGGTHGGTGGSGTGGLPGDAGPSVTVTPVESQELLGNPGMGWQTFHTFADKDSNLDGLPSGSAYFRFTWKNLEPTDGNVDGALLTDTLSQARAAGQTLMFRVMTAGSDEEYVPDWLASSGCKVFKYSTGGGPTLTAPDLDDATCWTRFENMLTAVGTAVGSEPDVQVDIGGVGLWGEWHFSDTTPAVPMPSTATRQKVVDLHMKLFPNSPKMALIGDVETLTYATGKGAGWRADCFGDYGMFSSTWNHMDNLYKQNVEAANAQNAWQKAPVAWESCGTMQDWVDKGFDVHAIFQYGVDLHGSFINNKSSAIPAGAANRTEIESALMKLGYRLVLRSLSHAKSVSAGGKLALAMSWDNVGVAPPYHPFKLRVKLTPTAGEPVVLDSSADLRSWVPGQQDVNEQLALPASMAKGTWKVSIGISGTPGLPMLRVAIEGRDADGWYPLSSVEVE
jgi:hypothetical protein